MKANQVRYEIYSGGKFEIGLSKFIDHQLEEVEFVEILLKNLSENADHVLNNLRVYRIPFIDGYNNTPIYGKRKEVTQRVFIK